MDNNSDGSNLSENSFNVRHMAEISRELSGQPKNLDLDSDSECNRDIDYRYFIKILMERDRSPNSRESSSSRSQFAGNSREHRRDQIRNYDRRRDEEWKCERDRSFPPYNYNATNALNSFVDSNRRDPPMMPGYNGTISPWTMNQAGGVTMGHSNMPVNQSPTLPMPSNLEMAQTSNSNVNTMSTAWNINPMNSMAVNQNNMPVNVMPHPPNLEMSQNSRVNPMNIPWNINPIDSMATNQNNPNQNSAMPLLPTPNLEMAQTSSSSFNPVNTPWNINPLNQNNAMPIHQSSATPLSCNSEIVQTSNAGVNHKKTRWNNPLEDVATSQNNAVIGVNQNSNSQCSTMASQENNLTLPEKELIKLTKSVLYPPNPFAPIPSRNEKPPGCKTVFVGGLPAQITEEVVSEIFGRCGAIESINMSLNKNTKKYFCHVRFIEESTVEKAMNLSGYRLKIDDKDEIPYSTRIHVDYAQSKTDMRDYEYKQRRQDQLEKDNINIENQTGMPISSDLEMTDKSNSSINSCAFMTGMGNYPQYHIISPQNINFASPVKEAIKFTKSVLYPPDPKAPSPNKRDKPPGCKTVFVGGLPHKASREILKEIFDICGSIKSLRMSESFCHVQFFDDLSVENAMYFSGYTMKIDNRDEAPYSSWLHVHYSNARDEEEIHLSRLGRHEDTTRSFSPEMYIYTDKDASRIYEKLKHETTFSQAASVLLHWLEKGVCKKKEAGRFYSMIQVTQNQVKQVQDDKVKYEETLNAAKSLFRKQMDTNIQKVTEVEKIYNAACVQKCWDNFTKTQRKNIEMWKKQTEELKNAHLEEVINEREDEEMELSDDENDAGKKNDIRQVKSPEYLQKMQEENNSLKCQLEAALNKIKSIQSEKEDSKNKDNQLSTIRTALQNSMKEVLDLNQKYSKAEAELKELRTFKSGKESDQNEDNDGKHASTPHDGDDAGVSSSINLDNDINLENDVRLVSLISTFLIVQPFGATLDYIWPYVHQIESSINIKDVENLMKRFPTLFKEESSGTESNSEKKWKFIGFQTFHTLS